MKKTNSIGKILLDSSISSILIILAVLVSLNFLISRKYVYLDFTEDKIYTTSESAKNILKNLSKDVAVNFYISKDLPVDLLNVKTQVVDTMNQYQDLAGTKLKIIYNEPENSDAKARELQQKGIPQMQFNVVAKDKYEVKQGFFGVEITAGEGDSLKREAIPLIQSVDSLEYDFISAVYSVSREKKDTLAFLEGHSEKTLQIPDLAKAYDISTVKIMTAGNKKGFYYEKSNTDDKGKTTSENIFVYPITLIIAGPTAEITSEEVAVIDDYIKNGGNVVILAESVNPDIQNNLAAIPVKNNLNELTKKYGIEIGSNLVYDWSSANISYRQGIFPVSVPYPFWVKALKENFSDNSVMNRIQAIIFPWASSLTLSDSADYQAQALVRSSDRSGQVTENYNLMPNISLPFSKGEGKIIAAVSVPKDKNAKGGSIFVIGDSDFVSPDFIGQIPDNNTFFMNLVDSVSNTANLSSIRLKNITDRPLKNMDESAKNYWKFVAIFGAAILVDIYGFLRIMRRKKQAK